MGDDSDSELGYDIEENGIIKDHIFPEAPEVKNEVLNYYDSEFESTPISIQHENLDEDEKPLLEENFQSAVIPNSEYSGSRLFKCNKIILGSKPNRASVDDDDSRNSTRCDPPNDINDISIDKGPKTNNVAVNEKYFEELVNCCNEPDVVLQDIQSYLQNSKRFCGICSILFPQPSSYDSHLKIYHTHKDPAESYHKNNDANKIYKCTICAKYFVAGHVLRRHMQNIHKAYVSQQKEKREENIREANETIVNGNSKTNIQEVKETTTKEHGAKLTGSKKITDSHCTDLSNTCFHCKKTFGTQKSLIEHLYDILQTKRKETEIVPVLKSVLFKCHKCDIHFTSSQFAAGHAQHMEMLVNWKCGICNRIFKKEDELSHERQHSVSNHFVVHNLGEIDVSKILFKCSKCGVHFSESNFLYHFRDCGLETTKSVHCKICDILLDYNTLHESDKHTDFNNFTVIRTDVISDNPVKPTVKDIQARKTLNDLHKSIREVKIVLQRIDSSKLNSYYNNNKRNSKELPTNSYNYITNKTSEVLKDNEGKLWQKRLFAINKTGQKYKWNSSTKPDLQEIVNRKRPANSDGRCVRKKRANIFFYCKNCKCFITNFRKTVHKEGRCIDYPKFTCKLCGLILTRNSRLTHKRLHESRKQLQLKDFRFCNLSNGRPMNPPVPEYPECTDCAVRFPSKSARHKHICGKEVYVSCDICKMKLSQAAFKLHMPFHQYSINYMKSLKTKPNTSGISTMKQNASYVPENDIPFQNSVSDTEFNDAINGIELSLQNSSETELILDSRDTMELSLPNSSSDKVEVGMSLNNVSSDVKLQDSVHEVDMALQNSSSDTELHDFLDDVDMPLQNSSPDHYEVIYTCGNCTVSVDTYDKAIEHCQEHYKNEAKEIITERCTDCNLKIDNTCYTEHRNLHKQGIEFKVLKFDSYYLPAENDLWIKHIFKTIPNEKVQEILNQSIYRFECRIKMDVVQQGDPHLTVYKCDQCSCFIEPISVFKHSENSCFKLRQHPCTYCGLPFISSASRINHEQIHISPGVTMDSYRIVVFNREQDKQINRSLCLRKNYVLYKCRICDVVIDKLQRDIHQCDFNNVEKCPYCALLLHSKEHEKHISSHKEFVSFNYSNMKVIILGDDNAKVAPNANSLKSTFKGAIYDYKMYICSKCEICIKNEKHICNFETQRSKCSKCDLYFSVGRLKTHLRYHERDPDFLRSNMNIVSFDPCSLDQNKNATLKLTANCEDSNSDTDSDIVLVTDHTSASENQEPIKKTTETIIEETAKIFKCPCALHFLNEDSLFRHFGACKSKTKISRQKCPKCELLFTTNILFTHLLAHHNNKSRRYKYDIIEMDSTQISMLQ